MTCVASVGVNAIPDYICGSQTARAGLYNYLRMERGGYTYILTNKNNTVLYVGVTSDLQRRVHEHKTKHNPNSFTAKYNCDKLVYFEEFHFIEDAIGREKNLKNWKREWKVELITKHNPDWKELTFSNY
jgi:putative endonuclease